MRRGTIALSLALMLSAATVIAQAPIYLQDNILVGGSWNRGLGSSDEVLVVQLLDGDNVIVDEGHPVKFFFNQTNNNLAGVTDWMAIDYDDSGWSDGVNGVGYNSSQTTAVPDTDDQGAIYTRFQPFGISNAPSLTQLRVRVDYDDAFILWLNGVEVVRANMGGDNAEEIAVPEWDFIPTSHESTNKPGPDPSRWDAAVSNLFGPGDDNPNGSIVDTTFDVVFAGTTTAVDPAGKLTTIWASLKNGR